MLSILRKGLVYNDISTDIVEHDLDVDADQWCYDGRDVYRGSFDPRYTTQSLNVYWLYDDNLQRIGLVEHEAEHPEVYKTLWFHDNPFATLYQDSTWKSTGKTLWSMLSSEAYQDCLEDDFKTVSDLALNSDILLVKPSMLVETPKVYECKICNKKSLRKFCSSSEESYIDFNSYTLIFIDDEFVIYERLNLTDQNSTLQQSDACEPVLQESVTELERIQESSDALVPPQEHPQSHPDQPASPQQQEPEQLKVPAH